MNDNLLRESEIASSHFMGRMVLTALVGVGVALFLSFDPLLAFASGVGTLGVMIVLMVGYVRRIKQLVNAKEGGKHE